MQIRKCQKSDVPSVGAFYDRIVLWLDNHTNYPKWTYREYPSEGYARAMTEAGGQYFCVEGERVIGAFVLNTDPQGAYQKGMWSRELPDGSYMVLHALAIEPEFHRKGLASKIIKFCTEKAKEEGYEALRVDIVPDNHPARKLYEENGFTYAGDADLERGIDDIPVFSLYELNW